MDDNRIEIVAGLDIPKTKSTIKEELRDEVKPDLDSSKALKIVCHIDEASVASLQVELNKITKNLKVDIPSISIKAEAINSKGVVSEISKSVKDQAKTLSDALDLAIPRGKTKEIRDTIQGLIGDYQRALQSGNYDETTKAFSALEKYTDQFCKDIQDTNQELVETQQRVKELARSGKTFISESEFNELKYILDGGKNASSKLSQAFGVGGWTKDASKATTSWDSKVQEINEVFNSNRFNQLNDVDSGKFADHINGVIELVEYLNKNFDQGSELAEHYGAEIDKAFGDKLYNELNRILGVSNTLDSEFIEIFNPDEIQQATQETQKLGDALQQALNKIPPSISIGVNTKDTLENAKAVLNNYFEASGVDSSANRIKRAVEDTSGELQRFYVQVERGDKSVETLTYALNEQGNAYEYLGKTIREADNSTDFRRKDISVQWDIQTEKLKQFTANAEKAGAASTVLGEDIKNLESKLAIKGDTNAMNAFLDDFDIAKAKLQAFNAEARKENAITALNNRIRKVTADIRKYAEVNERAVNSTKKMSNGTTFADAWKGIETLASKADLSDKELKQLITDIVVFKKEAQAKGLEGKSAIDKFLDSFKTMSSYITANMVFNFVKRQIRELANEVTAVDTAMTELRKVTEATNEEFEAFARSAGKTGRELGSSISDVINATATFARLGESLPDAEELGRVAVLYKNVGDGISEETAAEDLISTMKAFNIEAKDSIQIVDKLNEVETCPFYILVERNRRHIFSNCWEILKSFSLLFSKRRKSETSKRITYGEKKHIQSAKVVCVLSVV